MFRFWFYTLPVISLNIRSILSSQVPNPPLFVNDPYIERLKKLRGPPEGSVYNTYKDYCGVANDCEKPGDIGCEPGEKRRKRDAYKGEDYIKDGKSIPKFKYPWMALLAVRTEKAGMFFGLFGDKIVKHHPRCTGTLISMRHVVSARHCFNIGLMSEVTGLNNNSWNVKVTPIHEDKFYVLLGADRTGTVGNKYTFLQERKVLRVMIPPKTPYEDHDFGLLEIKDVSFCEHIRPICLPIDGIPLGGHYVMAGFGYDAYHFDPDTEEKIWGSHDALQEIDDMFVDPVIINPNENLTHLGGEVLSRHIVNPVDGTFAHDGTGVIPWFYINDADGRQLCPMDSGGPIMWRNPKTNRYFLIGAMWGTTQTQEDLCVFNGTKLAENIGTKVTYWMEYIYQAMRPISYAKRMCIPEECKDNRDTTWIQSNTMLMAPCGSPDDVDGFLCLKSESKHSSDSGFAFSFSAGVREFGKDRQAVHIGKQDYLDHGYTECEPCPANSIINWSYNYWANQITLGSFSQPRYYGVQSPFEMLKKYFAGILVNQTDKGCADYEYGGVTCKGISGKGICVSSDALCDGFNDCPNAWDENPNLCVGKCDYWIEHQESGHHWHFAPDCEGGGEKDVRACYQDCYDSDDCKLFQWLDKEPKGHCCHSYSDTIPSQTIHDSSALAIRGPGRCPGFIGIPCKPITSPPYRNGAFRIQSFSGRFLQVNVSDPYTLLLAALDRDDTWNRASMASTTEWIIKFHGARRLADSFVTIQSGVIQSQGHFTEPMYITVNYREINPDGGWVHMRYKLNDEFHDQDNKLDQRLYIRPIYEISQNVPPDDLMDLVIYTKYADPISKTVKIVRLFSEYGDKEYEHIIAGSDVFVSHVPDKPKLVLSGEIHHHNPRQKEGRFRMWECEYLNPHAHGIMPLPDKYKKSPHFFRFCEKKPFSVPAMHNNFGISYNRLKKFSGKISKYRVLQRNVCKAFKEAHTIWDYAGRMRLTTVDFGRMHYNIDNMNFTSTEPSINLLETMRDYFLENIDEYETKVSPIH